MRKKGAPAERPERKRRKTKIIIITACVLLLAASASVAALMIARPGLAYTVRSALFPPAGRIRMTPADPGELVYADVGDVPGMPGVVTDQSGMLISRDHPLPDGFEPELEDYRDTGVMMNRALVSPYAALSEKVASECGEKLYVMSAWRSAEQQAAEKEAGGDTAANAGESEHEAGLALDVYVAYYAGAGFLDSEAGKWVNSNCSDFGFIIRYPSWGTGSTGFGFEPWHIRYVGHPHAEIIMSNRLTLEKYFDRLRPGKWFSAGSWLICRQEGPLIAFPEGYESAFVSADNTGFYLTSFKMPAG